MATASRVGPSALRVPLVVAAPEPATPRTGQRVTTAQTPIRPSHGDADARTQRSPGRRRFRPVTARIVSTNRRSTAIARSPIGTRGGLPTREGFADIAAIVDPCRSDLDPTADGSRATRPGEPGQGGLGPAAGTAGIVNTASPGRAAPVLTACPDLGTPRGRASEGSGDGCPPGTTRRRCDFVKIVLGDPGFGHLPRFAAVPASPLSEGSRSHPSAHRREGRSPARRAAHGGLRGARSGATGSGGTAVRRTRSNGRRRGQVCVS